MNVEFRYHPANDVTVITVHDSPNWGDAVRILAVDSRKSLRRGECLTSVGTSIKNPCRYPSFGPPSDHCGDLEHMFDDSPREAIRLLAVTDS
jgi:hypothetical protein